MDRDVAALRLLRVFQVLLSIAGSLARGSKKRTCDDLGHNTDASCTIDTSEDEMRASALGTLESHSFEKLMRFVYAAVLARGATQ